jgi:hypothetical protein
MRLLDAKQSASFDMLLRSYSGCFPWLEGFVVRALALHNAPKRTLTDEVLLPDGEDRGGK